MGEVDLHFKPSVPVFDANVSLGRRHYKRVSVDTVDGTLEAMEKAGIQRAVAYSAHGAYWDPGEGNQLLLDMVQGQPSLIPQLIASPFDDLDSFAAQVKDNGVRSVRMLPSLYKYAFRDWAVKPWLDWMAAESLPVWLPIDYTVHVDVSYNRATELDPTEVHDTLKAHPDVTAVLCDIKDADYPWALLLLKSLPNLYLELSGFVAPNGITVALDAIGEERIIFGSKFPELELGPQLYNLHRNGLSEGTLKAICSGNLERILGMR